ncbi:hypothetical protein CPB85DRAFT_1185602, partial [Mucidula mucida]
LAVEVLRRGDGQQRRSLPREWRLCRLCQESVEDELHALLTCAVSEALLALRTAFWHDLDERDGGWR